MNNAFVFQFNPKTIYRVYDAIHNMPDGTDELVMDPGKSHTGSLIKGTKVYLWEAGGKDLVGEGRLTQNVRRTPMPTWQHKYSIGAATPDPNDNRVIIKVERCFTPPIKREQIWQNPILAGSTFFKNDKNPRNTCFKIQAEAARALDALIAGIERTRSKANGETAHEIIEIGPGLAAPERDVPIRVDDVGNLLQPSLGEDSRVHDGHLTDSDQPVSEADSISAFDPNAGDDTRERQLREVATRPGQALFKSALLDAYSRKCAVTGCDVEEVLEAAHILPYRNEACHHISNGLLLRSDIHVLFDRGLLFIGENWEIQVGDDLKGSLYGQSLEQFKLRLPEKSVCYPNKKALAKHRATLAQDRK